MMKGRSALLLLCLTGCPQILPRPANCTNAAVDGRETDVDCGGGQCPGCAVDRLCISDGDCASGVCTVNHCAAPTCLDGVRNGLETGIDCGGSCGPCNMMMVVDAGGCPDGGCPMPSCTNGILDGLESDIDCGGGRCPGCAPGLFCDFNTDCLMGVCSNGRCGAMCQMPLRTCNMACVDSRFDRSNCGMCGNQCPPNQLCTNGMCTSPCLGGTIFCGGACVDRNSNPAHCGNCNNACAIGDSCIGGNCAPQCPPGHQFCGGTCVATDRDPLHCGACNNPCGPGESCVGRNCVSGCQFPLMSCDGGVCVDPRTDLDNCGQCGQPCPPPPHAAPACANTTCIIGACQPGFDDCNGLINDGCEEELLVSQMHCGRCNSPCGPQQTCTFGQCCQPPPVGPYQMTCAMCQACNGVLQCTCLTDQMMPVPASLPLGPCAEAIRNCNGVLLCTNACP